LGTVVGLTETGSFDPKKGKPRERGVRVVKTLKNEDEKGLVRLGSGREWCGVATSRRTKMNIGGGVWKGGERGGK